MMRHRFRVSDPSAGRFLRNDGGVDSARAGWARSRVPGNENAAHCSLAARLAFHAHGAGKNRRLPAAGEVTTFTQP